MFAKLTESLDFHSKALVIRADRQRVIASNIANVDTPGYQGRDINFQDSMREALGGQSDLKLRPAAPALPRTGAGFASSPHLPVQSTLGSLGKEGPTLNYTTQSQPTLDGNSVDLDRERANFVDNSVRYEATLRFINGSSRTILSAIQGQ